MRQTPPLVLAAVAVLAAGLLAAVPEKMTADLERWLEDVGPVLTKNERAVFLKLATNAERAKFVRLFWRMRDPLPDTEVNEFQREYEERVRYADKAFGHFSPKRGSQTERGFFYLVLGPPLERTLYTTQSELWPLELWFYKGAEEYGLPGYFYLIFYQPEGLGDFRLYSPTVEGPEKLVLPTQARGGAPLGRSAAYQVVKRINGELAGATLSYLPSDSLGGAGSLSSDRLVASVRGLAEKKYSDAYARSFLGYKDHVETEYMDRFFACAFEVRVFRFGGQPFLHWSIEPDRMGFASEGGSVRADFELVLRLEDGAGRTVFERAEEIPVRVDAAAYERLSRQRFAFQDLLACAPGEYRALFLLKNKTAREFSSFEAQVSVDAAGPAGQPAPSGPLLFHARSEVPAGQSGNLKAFAFGGRQYAVSARNEFTPSSTLGAFLQVRGGASAAAGDKPAFVVDIVSAGTNEPAGRFPLTEAVPDPGDAASLLVSGTVPLADIAPGYYRAEASLVGADGRALAAGRENFVILDRTVPVVPRVYARLHGPFPGPEHDRVLAAQYFLKGAYAEARGVLERVLAVRDDPEARLLLAKALYGMGMYRESLGHASAVQARLGDRESAKVVALDHAGLKDWASALAALEKLMAGATEVPVLNLAAECYLALGRPEKALPLIEKSLALLPDQPAVKALEERARKRRP